MSVVGKVVHDVSSISLSVPLATWVNRDVAYDYAIGGLPFQSAANQNFPLQRKTAPYTKEQIDQSTEPGEQTLVNWWVRSQSSFHAGTGITYEEPTGQSDDTVQHRFQDAEGVDVWTPGKVKLLPKSPLVYNKVTNVLAFMGTGNNKAMVLDGSDLRFINLPSGSTYGSTVSNMFGPIATDGTNWFAIGTDGIYSGALGSSGSKIWNLPASSAWTALAWVKDRLMAASVNNSGDGAVYQLTGTGPTLPTPIYTSTAINFVSITESPQAIYAAGNNNNGGQILMFVLDTDGLLPTLTGGILAAELPPGERIGCIYSYLGTYMALVTNRGVRIAEIQADGSLQYGPITVPMKLTGFDATPSPNVIGIDRYLYGGMQAIFNDGKSGLWRIDLGTPVGFRQYAWAKDLKAADVAAGNGIVGVAAYDSTSGSGVAFAEANGVWCASTSNTVASGYLKTGNIRYHMLDPKLFKYARLFTEPLTNGSQVSIVATDDTGVTTPVAVHAGPTTGTLTLDKDPFPNQYGPHQWVALTITLAAPSGGTGNLSNGSPKPVMTAYQLLALPAQKRQRSIVLPLKLYDSEQDSNGMASGYQGRALERLRMLEAIEETGDIVQFDDLTKGGGPSRLVLIDNIQFVQTTTPSTDADGSGWGGIALVTLRAVD